jgi:hypothetical protein
MSLINCSECGKEVSSKAPACLGCGSPIAKDTESAGSGVDHLTTIQGTSKSLKLQSAIAGTIFVIGGVMVWVAVSNDTSGMGASSPIGALLLAVGLAWTIIVRVRKWWHHD